MISLHNKKFELFVERSEELPNIFSLKIHSKIEQFLNGVVPELTPDEREAIEKYLPHEVWSKFNQLTDEVIKEIKWNLVNVTSGDQKKDYLEYLIGILSPITSSLKSATWFEEIEKMDPNFSAMFVNRLEQNQIASFHLLRDLLWRSNRYYYVMYNKVEIYVQGLIITNGDVMPTNNKKNPLTTFFETLNNLDKKNPLPVLNQDQTQLTETNKPQPKLTHRHYAILYKYKADAKYIPNEFNPAEIEREFGSKRKQAIYTVWIKKGKTYRPVTSAELEVIIPFLEAFPDAQKAAINDLAKLK